MKPGERLAALEGLRGYAAMLVFFVHAFGLLVARLYAMDPEHYSIWGEADVPRLALVLLFRSNYGVDLFFVLSGLLMADLAIRRWPGTATFLGRRWLRIYPAYAASAIVVAGGSAFWFSQHYTASQVWGNIALLQGFFVLGIVAVNPVSWSLSFEAAFYLFVPLLALAWSGRAPAARPAAIGLAVAMAALVAIASAASAPKAIYLAYFALFVPGIALGILDDGAREQLAAAIPLSWAIAAWAAFALAVKLEALSNLQGAYYFASGAAGGLLVLKACDTASPLARWLSSPTARWLGKHSYSFFLIHYIVVHAWGRVAEAIVPVQSRFAYSFLFLAGSLALSLAAARALYAIAEQFYFRRARL
jgi:peptidoglycan/LPS O-acetylase OafA/YrhL